MRCDLPDDFDGPEDETPTGVAEEAFFVALVVGAALAAFNTIEHALRAVGLA